jgi:glutathione S-transferase
MNAEPGSAKVNSARRRRRGLSGAGEALYPRGGGSTEISRMLKVFTFSSAYDLPTVGPFGLKLEACLRMLDVPYEKVFEDDSRKGPKRKSPWIEDDGVRLGDTELILMHVARKYGKRLDGDLSPEERARSLVLRRMLEEHYHQVFEYELFVHDDGWAELRSLFSKSLPPVVSTLVPPLVRRSITKHLFERGIARHSPAEVEVMGRDDIDALSVWLGDREWFIAGGPTKVDAIAFGLLAVSIRSPVQTPVFRHARGKDNLVRFVDRAMARFFPERGAAKRG